MANFNADIDLETLLDHPTKGFDNDNVAGLGGLPDIRKTGDVKSAAAKVYGDIEIKPAPRATSEPGRTHHNEKYLLNGLLRYKDLNDPPISTIVRLMMDEFERVLDLNSQTADNGYIYEVLEAIPEGPNSNRVYKWIVQAIRYQVRADGT